MDWGRWNLTSEPLPRSSTRAECYWSEDAVELLLRCEYLFARGGTAWLQGPPGSGKTTLLRELEQRHSLTTTRCLRLSLAGLDGHDLVWQLVAQAQLAPFPDDSPQRCWSRLADYFRGVAQMGGGLVLLADDASQAAFGVSEALARVGKLAEGCGLTATCILAHHTTESHEHRGATIAEGDLQFALSPWTVTDIASFLAAASLRAGATQNLFSFAAAQSLFDVTGGWPGSVQRVADLALHAAYLEDVCPVTAELVEAVSTELHGALVR